MDAILPCCKFLQTLIVDKPLADPSFDNLLVAVALTVGLLWLSCVTLGLLKCTIGCLWPAKNLRKNGAWAVVTGATDGIGLGMLPAGLLSCIASYSEIYNILFCCSVCKGARKERAEHCAHQSLC